MAAGGPVSFRLGSDWELGTDPGPVWEVLSDLHTWPRWWPGLERVVEEVTGEPGAAGQRVVSGWTGPAGFSLRAEIEAVECTAPRRLQGVARGDVTGAGSWELRQGPAGTTVGFEWEFSLQQSWGAVLASVMQPLLASGQERVLASGARGLAGYLGCELVDFTIRVN